MHQHVGRIARKRNFSLIYLALSGMSHMLYWPVVGTSFSECLISCDIGLLHKGCDGLERDCTGVAVKVLRPQSTNVYSVVSFVILPSY